METANLKKKVMEILSKPEDEVLLRTLSILSTEEVYVLTIMSTLADFMRSYDEVHAAVLDKIVRNHLLMRISVEGAGRKDLKDVLNPRVVYQTYHAAPPPAVKEEKQDEKKRKRFLIF